MTLTRKECEERGNTDKRSQYAHTHLLVTIMTSSAIVAISRMAK